MEKEEAESKLKKAASKAKVKSAPPRRNSNGKIPDNRYRNNFVQEERAKLVIWRRPFQTLRYFVKEVPCSLEDARDR